jgi:tetratricopeptide (TPR) repeat protein
MKLLAITIGLLLLLTDFDKIGKINSLKSEAKKAYTKGDFKTAIEKYKYLVDSLGVKEEEVLLNLANSYFHEKDTANVQNAYLPLTQSKDTKLNSIANQQLGVVANRQGKLEEALNYFKQALKTAPDNEDARFNYEMVKKKLEDKKKHEQKDKENKDDKKDEKKDQKKDQKDKQNKDQKEKDKKDQEKKDQEKKDQEKKDQEKKDQEKKDKDQKDKKDQSNEEKEKEKKDKAEQQKEDEKKKEKEKQDNKPSPSEKLKDMNISEEKAKMILEAMKNQEVQYLQQNKRKATKPKDKGKPDW